MHEVGRSQGVTPVALVFVAVPLCPRCGAALKILPACYWFSVGWVNAPAITTQMVQLKAIWYWPNDRLVCKPMSTLIVLSIPERAVAASVNSTNPLPT